MSDHDQIIAALSLAIETLREQLLRERDRADRAERLLAECSTSLSLYKESKILEREEERECVRVAAREADGLSDLWREAALTERRQADLPDVDLDSEWRKLVLYDDGKQIPLCRWLKWARGARLDHTNQPKLPAPAEEPSGSHAASAAPKTGYPPTPDGVHETDWLHICGWALPKPGKRPFWAHTWGAPPDHPNCTLPAAAIAHALALRDARDSAAPAGYPQNLWASGAETSKRFT